MKSIYICNSEKLSKECLSYLENIDDSIRWGSGHYPTSLNYWEKRIGIFAIIYQLDSYGLSFLTARDEIELNNLIQKFKNQRYEIITFGNNKYELDLL